MKYDFTSIIDRRGMDSIAVEGIGHKVWGNEPTAPKEGVDSIPMWVADMNFATCPAVPAAVMERTKHPLYGYFLPRDEYYQSIINWQTKRNGFAGLKRDYIGYENGVHGCVTKRRSDPLRSGRQDPAPQSHLCGLSRRCGGLGTEIRVQPAQAG